MAANLVELTDTVHGKFYVYEIEKNKIWEVFHVRAVKGILFNSLESANSYIRDTERTTETNWVPLQQQYFKDGHLA